MKDASTYKDIYEILDGIGKKFKDLSDIEQANILPVYIEICA